MEGLWLQVFFYPTVSTKVWVFLTVRPCVTSREGEFSDRDVAGGGPQPCSGWALLNKRIAMVLSGLKVFINADFKDFFILQSGKNKFSRLCKAGTDGEGRSCSAWGGSSWISLVASPRAELTLAVPRDVHESGISLDRKTE